MAESDVTRGDQQIGCQPPFNGALGLDPGECARHTDSEIDGCIKTSRSCANLGHCALVSPGLTETLDIIFPGMSLPEGAKFDDVRARLATYLRGSNPLLKGEVDLVHAVLDAAERHAASIAPTKQPPRAAPDQT